jgi:DNA-binding transcriptional LysR family regulator
LTEAGEALVLHAEAVLTRLDAAQEEVAEIAGLRSGRVRVAAFPSASATLFPAAVSSLRASSPGVRVSLVEAEPPEALGLLRTGEADLALTFGYPESVPPARGEFEFEPLFADELLLVTGPGTKTRHPRLADFKDEAWIAGCERCRAHLLHLAAEAGFEPQIVYATDDYVTVQSLVAAGLGVTVLPSLALRAHRRPDVSVTPLGADAVRQIAAVVLPGSRPPAIAAMVDALRRAGQEIGQQER